MQRLRSYFQALRQRYFFRQLGPKALRSGQGNGMSLVEILVVIAIISLVGGLISVNVFSQLDKARKKRAFLDIKNIAQALELYKLNHHSYPSSAEGLKKLVDEEYLKDYPKDPWDQEYHYTYPGSQGGTSFDLSSYGPDRTPSDDDVSIHSSLE